MIRGVDQITPSDVWGQQHVKTFRLYSELYSVLTVHGF